MSPTRKYYEETSAELLQHHHCPSVLQLQSLSLSTFNTREQRPVLLHRVEILSSVGANVRATSTGGTRAVHEGVPEELRTHWISRCHLYRLEDAVLRQNQYSYILNDEHDDIICVQLMILTKIAQKKKPIS